MQPEEIPAGTTQSGAAEQPNKGFIRSVGLPTATAINMTQMCGIGPFITIPLMVAAFGGPQAIIAPKQRDHQEMLSFVTTVREGLEMRNQDHRKLILKALRKALRVTWH